MSLVQMTMSGPIILRKGLIRQNALPWIIRSSVDYFTCPTKVSDERPVFMLSLCSHALSSHRSGCWSTLTILWHLQASKRRNAISWEEENLGTAAVTCQSRLQIWKKRCFPAVLTTIKTGEKDSVWVYIYKILCPLVLMCVKQHALCQGKCVLPQNVICWSLPTSFCRKQV